MPRSTSSSNTAHKPAHRSPERKQNGQKNTPQRQTDIPENAQPKIYVSGLPANISKQELEKPFRKYASFSDSLVINRETFSFAFVTFHDIKDAFEAINSLTGSIIKGKTIKCEWSKPRPPRGNNDSTGNFGRTRDGAPRSKGCFKCGEEGHFAKDCTNPSKEEKNNRGAPKKTQETERKNHHRRHERSVDSSEDSPPKRNKHRRRTPSSSESVRKSHKKRETERKGQSRRHERRESPVKKRKYSSSDSEDYQDYSRHRPKRHNHFEQRKGRRRSYSRSSSR